MRVIHALRVLATRHRGLLWGLPLLSAAGQAVAQPVESLPLVDRGENRWSLPAGTYQGNFRIERTMRISCEPGATIDAQGQGNGLVVDAPGVLVEGCVLTNWGRDLTKMDSAVFVTTRAAGAELRDNQLRGVGFGIWVDGAADVSLVANRIEGDPTIRSQDRGNAIHLFAVKGAKVLFNQVRHARDGIYIETSSGNHLQGNVLEDLRYGIHYMFANDNKVIGNTTRRTRTGYALMQSRRLEVIGNRSERDQNYGILMNYITYSTIRQNVVLEVQNGSTDGDVMVSGAEGKALFIYNSLFNSIESNRFERSALGIHMTAGSEDNRIAGNTFVANQQQVKYVANRTQEWSQDGQGNYWSDYLGWDRDGDGRGDVPYEPNDNVDRLLWMYPQARLLMNSPSIEVLRWAQRAFPIVKSPGVQDSHPMMRPPRQTPPVQRQEARL